MAHGTPSTMSDIERQIAEAQAARKGAALTAPDRDKASTQRESEDVALGGRAAMDADIYGGGKGRFAGYDRR